MSLFGDELIAFAGVDKLRFVAPVFFGDRHPRGETGRGAQGARRRPGMVTFESRVLNQRNQLVVVYQDRLLVKRRPA